MQGDNVMNSYDVLIDRGITSDDESFKFKIVEVCKEAFYEGDGRLVVNLEKEKKEFSNRFELDGLQFIEPTLNLFSFNNPFGACDNCGGFGNVLGYDIKKIIPNESLSLISGCIAPWRTEKMKIWLKPLLLNSQELKVDIHKPYNQLSDNEKKIIWDGSGAFKGINKFFQHLERKSYKIQYRIISSRYKGKTPCSPCQGTGIREEVKNVKINKKSIIDVVLDSVENNLNFLRKLSLNTLENKMAKRPLEELLSRLSYIDKIGLGYLTLNRKVNTLSGVNFKELS